MRARPAARPAIPRTRGAAVVFSAEREGMELIGAVLSCSNWFEEAERMLDWGFKNYHLEAPLSAGEVACEAAVEGGMAGTVAAGGGKETSPLPWARRRRGAWSTTSPAACARAPRKRGKRSAPATLYIEGNARGANAVAGGGGCGKGATSQVPSGGCSRAGYCCLQPENLPAVFTCGRRVSRR